MAKKLIKYQAYDGQEFNTLVEAQEHERKQKKNVWVILKDEGGWDDRVTSVLAVLKGRGNPKIKRDEFHALFNPKLKGTKPKYEKDQQGFLDWLINEWDYVRISFGEVADIY